MKVVISSLLFSIGTSLKVSMRLNTKIDEPNTPDIMTTSVWLGNEYIKIGRAHV